MKIFVLCLLSLVFVNIYSQSDEDRQTSLSENLATEQYLEQVQEFSSLYYGKLHTPSLKGLMVGYYTPYLLPYGKTLSYEELGRYSRINDYYSEGSLVYNGIIYPRVTMLLDLYRDDLIVLLQGKNNNVIIDPLSVERAVIQGYHVFYLRKNNSKNCPDAGYYLLLEKNEYCTLMKKDAYHFIMQSTPQAALSRKVKYYLFKDNVYHQVSNKRSVLNVFEDKKTELDKYIKERNLGFEEDRREHSLTEVVKQYEKLKQQ